MSKSSSNRPVNIDVIRHSLAHLLAAAVLEKFPKAKLGIGPTIENGFYYDFKISRSFTPEDLADFEKVIKRLIKEDLPFKGKKITPVVARKLFKDQPFKLELIKDFIKEKKQLTAYSTGNIFMDLCKGGHVKNTKEIKLDAFKLTSVAGAYWKGDEKKAQLQRIYGVAFGTKKELKDYLWQQEEAKKRDHKILGAKLDLFTFSELVGPGLPLWTPKGTLLRDILDNFVWSLRRKRGYERVEIPHITKKKLYEVSGHWDKFNDGLFKIKTREGHEFAMKPMNCPHHIEIFKRKQWSYRDMPQRYANTTMCYRDEQTGELAGLSRTRAFTQDDAHVFCREGEMKEEFLKIWDIIDEFYKTVGFSSLEVHISGHDPKNFKAYLGTKNLWQNAENALKNIAKGRGVEVKLMPGEAAFYGPKIDFIARDSLGREWQVATIQLDMNLPERFDIFCIDEKGEHERLVVIHAAIMGSIERFLSIFIEHTGGEFPTWLSPVQVQILPISQKQDAYAKKVIKILQDAEVRVELTPSNETLGKRIREGEVQKTPYLLVIGDKEAKIDSVAVRKRGRGDIGIQKLSKFVEEISKEIAKRK